MENSSSKILQRSMHEINDQDARLADAARYDQRPAANGSQDHNEGRARTQGKKNIDIAEKGQPYNIAD